MDIKTIKLVLAFSLICNIVFFITVTFKLYSRIVKEKRIDITNDSYWRDKVSVYKILNKKQKSNIFFVGDSMIERFRVEEFFPNSSVFNRGNAWDDTESLLVRLMGTVITGNPRQVILSVGGNDIYYEIDPKVTLRNLQLIIEKLKARNILVSIISIIPVWHENSRDNNMIRQLNSQIQQLCSETGVRYIDVSRFFLSDSGELRRELSTDGVHLNGLGYELFAEKLALFL